MCLALIHDIETTGRRLVATWWLGHQARKRRRSYMPLSLAIWKVSSSSLETLLTDFTASLESQRLLGKTLD